MEESSKEQPPRCPCGFWGSQKTLGLCSKCYCEAQRNQSQNNLHTSDSSKSSIGSCHSQSRNCKSSNNRMDSKHFPSHSTTDNLPSSLPADHSALAAATSHQATSVDSTNSNTNTGSNNMSNVISSSVEPDEQCSSDIVEGVRSTRCTNLPVASDSDTQSSASSDQTYNPLTDSDGLSSVSCTSLASMPSSIGQSSSGTAFAQDIQKNSSIALPNVSDLADATQATNSSPSGENKTDNIVTKSNIASSSTKDSVISVENEAQASSSTSGPVVEKKEKQTIEEVQCQNSPLAKGVKRSREEMEASIENKGQTEQPSPQKNKKRCFTCSCKLELAQRTIGRCRCDRIFCALHRLPELHFCEFNHKEDGRREAREKMVKPTRHLGPSFRRDDHL